VTIVELQQLLKAEMLCEQQEENLDIRTAKASDLMSDVLSYTGPGELLLTGLTNHQVVRTCEIAGIRAIVFVRGKRPSDETVSLAAKCNICMLATKFSMFESCGILFSNGVQGVTQQTSDVR
jgi:predicted transcriptional regulator